MKIKFLISISILSATSGLHSVESIDINHKDEHGYTALHRAILNDRQAVAQALIDAGANVNLQDNSYYTPLMMAIQKNQPGIVQRLIAANADLNIKGDENVTALMLAALDENSYIINQLISAGARLDDKEDSGATALIMAVNAPNSNNDTESIQKLIAAGADVNVQDTYNNTPLSIAMQQEKFELLKKLLAAGADLNLVDINLLQKTRNRSYGVNKFLEFKENLIDSDTFKRLYDSNRLQDLALKKIYVNYLQGNKTNLQDLFNTSGISNKFKNYFKPEFVQSVIEKR